MTGEEADWSSTSVEDRILITLVGLSTQVQVAKREADFLGLALNSQSYLIDRRILLRISIFLKYLRLLKSKGRHFVRFIRVQIVVRRNIVVNVRTFLIATNISNGERREALAR